jgi:RND family efflux transporter MFP subunit
MPAFSETTVPDFSKMVNFKLHLAIDPRRCLAFACASACSLFAFADEAFIVEGFSQPNRIAKVSASTSGIVKELLVREGSEVKKDECLCRMDSKLQEKLLEIAAINRESKGELQAAETEVKNAEMRLQTLRDLASRQHASEQELQRAVSDFETAQAGLQMALEKQALRNLEFEKLQVATEQFCVRAPFDGVVTEFSKEEGEFVGVADYSVCTVAELSTLSVDFLVPRHYHRELKVDSEINVVFTESQKTVRGIVYYVSPYPNGETNTYSVKIRVDNSDRVLSAGERCQLELEPPTSNQRSPERLSL